MPIEHGLALLIFVGRLGDILSTQYMTPNLVLEANPIVRRFRRTTYALGFALCAAPYFYVPLGIMVAVAFLLTTASNLGRAWIAHTLGEEEMQRLALHAAARSSLASALLPLWGSAAFVVLAAAILWWLDGDDEIASFFAAGMAVYALALAMYATSSFVRIFRRAAEK